MDLNIKQIIAFEIIIIVAALILTIAIWQNGKDLSCEQCQIKFIQTKALGRPLDTPKIIIVNLTYMYYYFQQGRCSVIWDNQNGYYVLS